MQIPTNTIEASQSILNMHACVFFSDSERSWVPMEPKLPRYDSIVEI